MKEGDIIAEFRAGGGRIGGPFPGANILLLHHTGARGGTNRVKAAPRRITVVVLDPVK
jgi:hypothetical protein